MIFTIVAIAVTGCAGSDDRLRHEAEKRFFTANKLRTEWSRGATKDERFGDRAIDEYRAIVGDYADDIGVDGIETVVVASQMNLAEMEFQIGRVIAARDDFEAVARLDGSGMLPTRIAGLFRAAQISEQIGDTERAMALYETVYKDYLENNDVETLGSLPPIYLNAPLKVAELSEESGAANLQTVWLQRAEEFYDRLVSAQDEAPGLAKQGRFNLLTTYSRQLRWDDALALVDTLSSVYTAESDRATFKYIRANIHQRGLNDLDTASRLYREIYETQPATKEAPSAVLLDASLSVLRGDLAHARRLYQAALDVYGQNPDVENEARWQLARIAEAQEDWVTASLHYKAITAARPTSRYGFESPLRIIDINVKLGDDAATRVAYANALDGYRKIADAPHSISVRLRAEDYILQVYTRQESWEQAIDHLTSMLRDYPEQSTLLQGNFLTAAKISEEELGDDERAASLLRECIELHPQTRTATVARERLESLMTEP